MGTSSTDFSISWQTERNIANNMQLEINTTYQELSGAGSRRGEDFLTSLNEIPFFLSRWKEMNHEMSNKLCSGLKYGIWYRMYDVRMTTQMTKKTHMQSVCCL